ncbi:hypothetical protein ACO9S2_09610 [Nitrospira sp. NS4]|uniref:hypothetical protein n=1 Tax=Nitrospira sp. NS4 TaxID=3414498 RepID=UPI003C2C72A4
METQDIIDRVFNHVEAGEIDNAVIACLRLARKVGDSFNVIMFLRELCPDSHQFKASFAQETQHLNEEACKRLWKDSHDHWIAERTLDVSLDPDDEDRKVLVFGVGQLKRQIEQTEKSIEDLRLPESMGEFDTAAFTDRNRKLRAEMRFNIQSYNIILERVRTRCLYYASRIEGQLEAVNKASSLIASLQDDVHNYYASRSDAAYQSLCKAATLISSTDAEDHALLLTSIRRAVKAATDFHYPPASAPVVCHDGQVRNLGEEQYLNRLQEFCARQFHGSASNKLLQAELDFFSSFVRRLHEVTSKGVHAEVSHIEARQGLLGAYLFFSNLIAKLDERDQ